MSCSWEGMSGVALAMCHRLQWFIHLQAQGPSKTDEHPINTPHVVTFPVVSRTDSRLVLDKQIDQIISDEHT